MGVLVLRIAAAIVGAIVIFVAATSAAFQLSPWPAALLIRLAFDDGARAASAKLQAHVPPGIVAFTNVAYDADDRDGLLDVYLPADAARRKPLAAIVWIHGGGWISGTKNDSANYAKILAAKGYAVASVDYTVAPEATYPTPVREVQRALAFLTKNGATFHMDPNRFVLAGDSSGAQIAAQVAATIDDPAYARAVGVTPGIDPRRLKAMLLYCGAYDLRGIRLEGSFGGLVTSVLWAYSGSKHFATDPHFATASVVDDVTRAFPPAFISVGNADALAPQSYELAKRLRQLGVRIDALFFARARVPALGHEYQFDLDTGAGREALWRVVRFLRSTVSSPA